MNHYSMLVNYAKIISHITLFHFIMGGWREGIGKESHSHHLERKYQSLTFYTNLKSPYISERKKLATKGPNNHLVFGEATPDGSGFLRAQIKWQVLLVLVRFPQCRLLLLRNHRQHLRNRQPHHLSAPTNTTETINKKHPPHVRRNYTKKIRHKRSSRTS